MKKRMDVEEGERLTVLFFLRVGVHDGLRKFYTQTVYLIALRGTSDVFAADLISVSGKEGQKGHRGMLGRWVTDQANVPSVV